MKRAEIKSGDRFGMLTIIEEIDPHITPCGTIRRRFLTKCDCGKSSVVGLLRLTSKHIYTLSCGCAYDPGLNTRKYTKEQKSSFLYSTWNGMLQRCYYKNGSHYKHYGERGISVCKEWRDDYLAFYNWAIKNGASKDFTIDRIDVNGDYCPENCRWVDAKTQMRNRQYNRYLEYNGERKLLIEWAEERGIDYDVIRNRLDNYGYSIGEALEFVPHQPKKREERPETRKTILQYEINGKFVKEWSSANEIQKELGIPVHSIRGCCMGYNRTSHGFVWIYKDGVRTKKIRSPKEHRVMQYSIDGTLVAKYDSVRRAAIATNISAHGIQQFCNGNKNNFLHCGGYLWAYEGNDIYVAHDRLSESWTQYRSLTYNGETKQIADWAKETGLRTTTIASRMKRGWSVGESLGFEHHARNGAKHKLPILQLDKNMNVVKEYHSLHFVRKETNRSKKTILRYLENGELDNQGYYWRYKKD